MMEENGRKEMYVCLTFDEKYPGQIYSVRAMQPGETIPKTAANQKVYDYEIRSDIKEILKKGVSKINAGVLLTSKGSPDCVYWEVIETPNFYYVVCLD